MESVIIEIAKQVPSLAALIFLVLKFLSSLEKRDEALANVGKQVRERSKDDTDLMAKVLTQNSMALSANTHALGRMESVLDDLDPKTNREP
jgi:hypothetical protein